MANGFVQKMSPHGFKGMAAVKILAGDSPMFISMIWPILWQVKKVDKEYMQKKLEKIALVTGGTRGLGRGICEALALSGKTVIINYCHNHDEAARLVEKLHATGAKAIAVAADVTSEQEVRQLFNELEQRNMLPHILINNATGPQPEKQIMDCNWDDCYEQLKFFVKAPLLLSQAIIPFMKEQSWGRIINIGSEVVQLGNTDMLPYVAAKGAMITMTRSMANALGPYGITVNVVNPGWIPVERHAHISRELIDKYSLSLPLRRTGKVSDVAAAVKYLTSDEAGFVTGQILTVNGGNTFSGI